MDSLYLPFFNLDDNSFLENVIGISDHRYPLEVIDNLSYNPFKESTVLNSVDNFIRGNGSTLPNCQYHFCENFSKICGGIEDIKILSFNICSLPLHFDVFQDQCLSECSVNFDVIGLCETRLNDNISQLYIMSFYNAFHQNKGTSGGGVSIYLHTRFEGKIRHNISLQKPYIETLFVELIGNYKYIVGMVYRPPNANFTEFLKTLEDIIEQISSEENIPCFLMGDFNINLINHKENNVCNFANLLYSHSFFPTITKPTRVTETSATVIDHNWINNIENYRESGVIYTDISDHFPVFTVIKLKDKPIFNSNIIIKKGI